MLFKMDSITQPKVNRGIPAPSDIHRLRSKGNEKIMLKMTHTPANKPNKDLVVETE